MKQIQHIFLHWLPLCVGIVLTFGFSYVLVQQNYRQSLNDPQVAITQDAKITIEKGVVQPKDIVQTMPTIDAEQSLLPFVAFFDESGNLLDSSATLGGLPLKIPQGVLDYAKTHGEDRVTWQPNASTRIALVVRPLAVESGWFVVSGRNMSEIESRISNMTKMTILGLLTALCITFVFDAICDAWRRKSMSSIQN